MIAKKVARKQASRLRLKPVTRYLQRVEEESCEEASVASAIETSLDIGDLRLQQSCEEASVASAIETHGKHGNGRTIHFVARKQASRLRLKHMHDHMAMLPAVRCEEASVASAIETASSVRGKSRPRSGCEEASVASAIETLSRYFSSR